MPAGKVNESLSNMMAHKGDDGLSDAERKAYAVCQPLSCEHVRCYQRYMYSPPARQKEKCGPLMAAWQACFDEKLAAFSKENDDLVTASTVCCACRRVFLMRCDLHQIPK